MFIGRTSTDFHSDRQAPKLLESFNRFRKDGHLCDVKFKVGNRTFSAHKVIQKNLDMSIYLKSFPLL